MVHSEDAYIFCIKIKQFSLFSCSHTSDSIYNIDKMGKKERVNYSTDTANSQKNIISLLKQNLLVS